MSDTGVGILFVKIGILTGTNTVDLQCHASWLLFLKSISDLVPRNVVNALHPLSN